MTDYYEHKLDPVDVRPDWLADGDFVEGKSQAEVKCGNEWCKQWGQPTAWIWSNHITAIRIPRDHWAVPALERGFIPTLTKPDDYAGGDTLWSDLSFDREDPSLYDFYWDRDAETRYVIGYRPKPTASEHPEYSPELVERMVALVESMTGEGWDASDVDFVSPLLTEARSIKRAMLSEADPLAECLIATDELWDSTEQHASALRAELDKRGYAITRKDEAA